MILYSGPSESGEELGNWRLCVIVYFIQFVFIKFPSEHHDRFGFPSRISAISHLVEGIYDFWLFNINFSIVLQCSQNQFECVVWTNLT